METATPPRTSSNGVVLLDIHAQPLFTTRYDLGIRTSPRLVVRQPAQASYNTLDPPIRPKYNNEVPSPAKNLLVEFVSTPQRKSNMPSANVSPAALLWGTLPQELPDPEVVEDVFYSSPKKRVNAKPKRGYAFDDEAEADDPFGYTSPSKKLKKANFAGEDLFGAPKLVAKTVVARLGGTTEMDLGGC